MRGDIIYSIVSDELKKLKNIDEMKISFRLKRSFNVDLMLRRGKVMVIGTVIGDDEDRYHIEVKIMKAILYLNYARRYILMRKDRFGVDKVLTAIILNIPVEKARDFVSNILKNEMKQRYLGLDDSMCEYTNIITGVDDIVNTVNCALDDDEHEVFIASKLLSDETLMGIMSLSNKVRVCAIEPALTSVFKKVEYRYVFKKLIEKNANDVETILIMRKLLQIPQRHVEHLTMILKTIERFGIELEPRVILMTLSELMCVNEDAEIYPFSVATDVVRLSKIKARRHSRFNGNQNIANIESTA